MTPETPDPPPVGGAIDLSNDRQICTKDAPMSKGAKGHWQHPDAKDVGEEYNGLSGGGDYDIYLCPNCELRFYVELPD